MTLSLSVMSVSVSAMATGALPAKKAALKSLSVAPELSSSSRSIRGMPSSGRAYSRWSSGALAETPLYDSATRLPLPESVSAMASPDVQPGRSTISWMTAEMSLVC